MTEDEITYQPGSVAPEGAPMSWEDLWRVPRTGRRTVRFDKRVEQARKRRTRTALNHLARRAARRAGLSKHRRFPRKGSYEWIVSSIQFISAAVYALDKIRVEVAVEAP